MLERVVGIAVRRRATVLTAWLLLLVFGALAALHIDSRLTAVTTVPGSPSAIADARMQEVFGGNFAGTFSVIYPFDNADEAEIDGMKQAVTRAATAVPRSEVAQLRAVGGTLYALIATELPLLEASDSTDALRKQLTAEGLVGAMVTGPPALEHDVRPVLADDLRRGAVVGGAIAIAILLFAFGVSLAALVPVIAAVATIALALLMVYVLSFVIPMVLYVPNIVELIGLGIALDYALLIVHRVRQERAGVDDATTALVRGFATAGRTVWWAGLTAGISLFALVLVPVPLVRSLAVAGVVVPGAAVLMALTLLPALLAKLGDRVTVSRGWPGVLGRALPASVSRFFRHPRRVVLASTLALLLLAAPMLGIRIAPASLTAVPADVPAAEAVQYLQKRVGPGAVTPNELLIEVGEGRARTAANDAARRAFAGWLSDRPGVFGVFTDSSTGYVDPSGGYQRIFLIGRHDFADERTADLVRQLRTVELTTFGYEPSVRLFVGGAPAQGVDFLDALRTWSPWLLLLVLAAAVMALWRILRSAMLATISVGLNLLTLGAVYGSLVLLFQRLPFGPPSGLAQVTHLESWALLLLFAFLFALSMDYQMFVLTRMREQAQRTGDLPDAVLAGTRDTAGVIMIAAAAFIASLSGLVLGRIAGLQELGVGLAIGVLLDATVVRVLLLPNLVLLLRQRIWQ